MYLGKRDFVDHLDKVDPVGKCAQKVASYAPRGEEVPGPRNGGKALTGTELMCPLPDGVVLVDPDYLKDRKGTGPESRGPRGGRERGRWGNEMGWH